MTNSMQSSLSYIYVYAFSRRFYPKRLTVHLGYTFFVSMCVHWESNPQPLHCSTTEPQEPRVLKEFLTLLFNSQYSECILGHGFSRFFRHVLKCHPEHDLETFPLVCLLYVMCSHTIPTSHRSPCYSPVWPNVTKMYFDVDLCGKHHWITVSYDTMIPVLKL